MASRNAEYYDAINRYTGEGFEASDPGGSPKSIGFGIAERPNVSGVRVCVSKTGCKLGDGRKKLTDDDLCGLCGGRVVKR